MTSDDQAIADKMATSKIADELREAAQTNVTQGRPYYSMSICDEWLEQILSFSCPKTSS